jgi:hypothetical protein
MSASTLGKQTYLSDIKSAHLEKHAGAVEFDYLIAPFNFGG